MCRYIRLLIIIVIKEKSSIQLVLYGSDGSVALFNTSTFFYILNLVKLLIVMLMQHGRNKPKSFVHNHFLHYYYSRNRKTTKSFILPLVEVLHLVTSGHFLLTFRVSRHFPLKYKQQKYFITFIFVFKRNSSQTRIF